jgi:threonine dehydrogenase-like Zn-dependent dehydrogenase
VHILEVPPGHPATPGAILGHEYIGRVLEVGQAVTNVEVGDRVVVAPNLTCGLCRYCRLGMSNMCESFTTLGIYLDGGFAEYNVAPSKALYKISPDLPLEEAVFTELLSCVVGGTEKVRIQPGETAVILGAGPVGLMFTLIFKAAGAGKVIVSEISPFRLDFAKRVGADVVVNPREQDLKEIVLAETGIGADVVVDAVGSLFTQAMEVVRKGGKIVLFGMDQRALPKVSQYDITRNELLVIGTFIGVNTFPPAIKMLESGAIKPSVLLTHRLPLNKIEEGIKVARSGEAIKVMILPG